MVSLVWNEYWSSIIEIFCGDSTLCNEDEMVICAHRWCIDQKIQSCKCEKPNCGHLLKIFIQCAMHLNFCTQWANAPIYTTAKFILPNLRLNFAFWAFLESFKLGQQAQKKNTAYFEAYNLTIEEPWTVEKF